MLERIFMIIICRLGVPRDVAPVINHLATKHLGRVNSLEPRFMYAWTKKDLPTMPE